MSCGGVLRVNNELCTQLEFDRQRPFGKMLHMLLALIAGYLVSVFFAFCGIVCTASVLMSAEKGMDTHDFFSELAQAAWPLAVSAAVYILTRILYTLTQQQIMQQLVTQQEAKPVAASTPIKKPAPLPQGAYFKAQPAPQRTPSIQEAKAHVINTAHEEEIEDEDAIKVVIPRASSKPTPHKQQPESELSFFRVE